MKLTHAKLKEMYLDYVNNYLTVQTFADHYNFKLDLEEEKPISFYQSIINRGRCIYHSELARDPLYSFVALYKCNVSSVNYEFHQSRANQRLLSECSA